MRLLPSLKEWFLVTGYSSMAAYITKLDVTLFRLKTQTVFAGRQAEVLGAVATEIRKRCEVHHVGYLGERQAFII